MKLALKDNQKAANAADLIAVDVTGLADQYTYMLLDTLDTYRLYKNAVSGGLAANGGGRWYLDNRVLPCYSIADNYDFGANSATDMQSDFATLVLLNWQEEGYTLTPNDINQIADLVTWEKLAKRLDISESIVSPVVYSVEGGFLGINESSTVTLTGNNYDSNCKVRIPNFGGTVDAVRVMKADIIEVDITADGTAATYSIEVFNGNASSTTWINDGGLNTIDIVTLPNGQEKILRIASATGDNYVGTSFAKSEYSNGFRDELAFDNNTGTRHYSTVGSQQDHYIGIIMLVPTLLTNMIYIGDYGSNPFRLEGSNNTTNGTDGTWDDLGDYTINSIGTAPNGDYVYTAFRLVWSNPVSISWANVRELRLFGRQ